MSKKAIAALKKKAGVKKQITAKQRAARKINIEVARKSKKKKTRFGNAAIASKKKKEVAVEKKITSQKPKAKKVVNQASVRVAKKQKKYGSKTTIAQASKALASRGYKLGKGKFDMKTMTTMYEVKAPGKRGRVKKMSADQIMKMLNG